MAWSPITKMWMKGRGESDLVAVRSLKPPFEGVLRSPLPVFSGKPGSVFTRTTNLRIYIDLESHGQGHPDP